MPAVAVSTAWICISRRAQSFVIVARSFTRSADISSNFSMIAVTRCRNRGPVRYR